MPSNVTVQAPASMYNAQFIAPDGTAYQISSTGMLTIPSNWLHVALNAGFTMPSVVHPLLATQVTSIASGNGALAAAQMAGAELTDLITSGATALTTPSAAALLAATPNGQIGMSYVLRIINTNAGTLTITADASITTTGTMTIATNTWREFVITFTSATTATMKSIGTGTTS